MALDDLGKISKLKSGETWETVFYSFRSDENRRFWAHSCQFGSGYWPSKMGYFQGCSTALEVTKIGVFGHIHVSLVQNIGQARWLFPRVFYSFRSDENRCFWDHSCQLGSGYWPSNLVYSQGCSTALEVTKIGVFGHGLLFFIIFLFNMPACGQSLADSN